jgi:hypothetical protein
MPQHTGNQARHRVHNHHRRYLSAGQDIVADRNLQRLEADADAFCAAGSRIVGSGAWFAGKLSNAGLHIYYNCSNLVQKIPALPGGFPWNLPENKGAHHYEKGTCPVTDDLLARSVGMSIPPDLSPIHCDARIDAINRAFKEIGARK